MTEKHFTWCPLPDILESWGKPDLGYNNFMIARWKDRKNIGSWWFSWWARTNMEAQIPLNFLHLKCNTFLSHCVLVAQSCLTLCNPVDCSLPGFSVHGILQARILEWVSISLLQGIFPIQGSNPGILHCRQILYHWDTKAEGSVNACFREKKNWEEKQVEFSRRSTQEPE